MAQEPLATKGNFLHIYDFRVTKGKEDEFIRLFETFDYSDGNPMHKSSAQVKDGVLCRDTEDPQRFFLIAEWSDIEEHARIRKILANEIKPEFIKHIEGGKFVPKYVDVVRTAHRKAVIGEVEQSRGALGQHRETVAQPLGTIDLEDVGVEVRHADERAVAVRGRGVEDIVG